MRVLTSKEIDDASGGVGVLGAGIGAVIGFGSAIYAGASLGRVFAATVLGAMSGFAGNLAGSAAAGGAVVRGAWAARSAGLGVASSAAATKDEPDS